MMMVILDRSVRLVSMLWSEWLLVSWLNYVQRSVILSSASEYKVHVLVGQRTENIKFIRPCCEAYPGGIAALHSLGLTNPKDIGSSCWAAQQFQKSDRCQRSISDGCGRSHTMAVARPVRFLGALSIVLVLFLIFQLTRQPAPISPPASEGYDGGKIEKMDEDPLLSRKSLGQDRAWMIIDTYNSRWRTSRTAVACHRP